MTDIRYIQSTERQVGEAHPTLSDTLNRALRDVLTGSGLDPDADFGGFTTGPSGTGSPEGAVTADVGQIYRQTDGANGTTLWMKNSGTGNTGWRPFQTSLGVFNVKDFGAKGDGTTDDTAAIQAAFDAAGTGSRIIFPPATYKTTSVVTLAIGAAIEGYGATLNQTTTDVGALALTASDSLVAGLTITGPDSAASGQKTAGIGLHIYGASAAAPVTNIRVVDCTIRGFTPYGLRLKYVDGFSVRGTRVTDIGYAGIMVSSSHHGTINGCTVDTIGSALSSFSYGISLNRASTVGISNDPRCSDIAVTGNTIANVAFWEGLDTHGGQRVTFADNVVLGCKTAIAVVSSDNELGASTYAPLDVLVIGNVCDSGVTDGSYTYGISFAGAADSGEKATGVISGNTVRGYGAEASTGAAGAIYLRTTDGVVVSSNLLIEPSPYGINFYIDNTAAVCSGNLVRDAWTSSGASAQAYTTNSTGNEVLFLGNRLDAGSKSATHVNDYGLRINNATGTKVTLGPNELSIATTPIWNNNGAVTMGPGSVLHSSAGDADYTYQVGAGPEVVEFATTLTANRTVTLSTTNGYDGALATFIRSAAGAFTLAIGGLYTFPASMTGTVRIVFRNGAWKLAGVTAHVTPAARSQAWTAKTTTYTVLDTDDGLFLGGTSWTLTLQSAATRTRPLYLRCTASGTVTIARAGSDTIEGATSLAMVAGERMTLMPNGTDWLRVD